MTAENLMQAVFTTYGMLFSMIILSCLCCVCMKYSDLKLQHYLVETAKEKGIKLDVKKLDPKYCQQRPPQIDEICTIMIPDGTIVL